MQEVYAQHLQQARTERQKYYHHNIKAKDSSKYLSIIIDGMTQNSTRLPHFARKASHYERKAKVQGTDESTTPFYECHCMGVLIEQVGAFMEFSFRNLSNGADLVYDTLHRAIARSQDFFTNQGE